MADNTNKLLAFAAGAVAGAAIAALIIRQKNGGDPPVSISDGSLGIDSKNGYDGISSNTSVLTPSPSERVLSKVEYQYTDSSNHSQTMTWLPSNGPFSMEIQYGSNAQNDTIVIQTADDLSDITISAQGNFYQDDPKHPNRRHHEDPNGKITKVTFGSGSSTTTPKPGSSLIDFYF
jgi:hypothetical protein